MRSFVVLVTFENESKKGKGLLKTLEKYLFFGISSFIFLRHPYTLFRWRKGTMGIARNLC